MTRSRLSLLGLLAVLSILAGCATPRAGTSPPAPTILVSIDGFRADYLDLGVTPELSRLAGQGAYGAIRPSFPSKTFPNHYTLVTGLRPDRHGLVDNNMRDPQIPGVEFKLSNREAVADPRWWNDGEPLWVTAERAGVRTATMFWPGSEAPIRGIRPSLWRAFDQSVSADARVDQVLAWMDAPPAERPRFVTLYFDEVDTVGHWSGPRSPELAAALASTDAAMARLTDGLVKRGIAANLVIVADHGMAEVAADRVIYLDDIAPAELGAPLTIGAFLSFYPAPGREAQAEAALLKSHERMECWRKGEIPARYHFGAHRRVAPIICLPQTGWEISTRERVKTRPIRGGDHGFDPYAIEMRALFIGVGPAFRRGAKTPLTDNVDVYPVLAKLVGVAPAPNDGGDTLVRAAMKP